MTNTIAELIGKKIAVWLIKPPSEAWSAAAGFGGRITRASEAGIHVDVAMGIEPRETVLPLGLAWEPCSEQYCFYSDFEVDRDVEWCVELRDDALNREAIERMVRLHKKDFEAFENRADEGA